MSTTAKTERTGRGRAPVLILVAAALLVAGYFAFGMPGMDDGSPAASSSGMDSMDPASMSFTRLEPDEFAARMAEPSAFVVNVHTPYEGEIDGTDAFIAYDRVLGDARLPTDKSAEILLYCRSGRMSASAAEQLVDAGYTSVSDLEGGMEAWRAEGRTVRVRTQNGED